MRMEIVNGKRVLWVHLNRVDAQLLECDRPDIICCPCTGLDHIDLAECQRRGIKVLSLRDTDVLPKITATAEHTIGLILALVRKIPQAVESTKRGEWDRSGFMGRELRALELFVVGEGRIGRQVERGYTRLQNLNEQYYEDHDFDSYYTRRKFKINKRFSDADIVSIHVDLNDTTRGMCNAEFFSAMKPGSYFVNTSRGQVVDEDALLDALKSGHLAGAALDVVCGESDFKPPKLTKYGNPDNPGDWIEFDGPNINPELVKFANKEPCRLILTPHIGGYTSDSVEKAETALAKRLLEEINGTER